MGGPRSLKYPGGGGPPYPPGGPYPGGGPLKCGGGGPPIPMGGPFMGIISGGCAFCLEGSNLPAMNTFLSLPPSLCIATHVL